MLPTPCDVGAFVVPSQQEEVLRVFDLVTEKEENSFEALLATVDIIAKEKIIGGGRETTHFEQPNEVRVLAMNVANNLDGRRELDEGGLAEKDFARCKTDGSDLVVFETERFADFACVSDVK